MGVTSYQGALVIDRCLSSLVDQTLGPEQIEVLEVDDGSKDRTASLAMSFSGKAEWVHFEVHSHKPYPCDHSFIISAMMVRGPGGAGQ
ncbi:glycosyltransferase [Nesterenkonia ebinurensis]|uniref:glycosyltransferase n=1 Tax=Nesterenkonia ebinurensis TaxID=2608252 RepID=UPI00168AA18F